MATISFVTHNKFMMKAVMNLLSEVEKEQSGLSVAKRTQDLKMISQNFAGMDLNQFEINF